MSGIKALKAQIRENTGKGSARALRRAGEVPAIIYGGKKEDVKISTSRKDITKLYHTGKFHAQVIDIDLGKEKIKVLPCDIQLHPVTDFPLHADFMRVSADTKVHVFVHVKFLNEEKSPGLKRGGVLSIIRREVELLCRADSIPEVLEIDLDGVKIGESLHAHSIKFPDGVEPAIKDRDFTIATIVGRSQEEDEDEVETVEGEEGAEGESTEGETSEAAE